MSASPSEFLVDRLNTISVTAYPMRAPQDAALPSVIFSKVASERVMSHDGVSRLTWSIYQIDVIDESFATAETIADQVRTCLNGYKGNAHVLNVYAVLMQSEQHFYEEDLELFRVSQEYKIWHYEDF